MLRPFIGHVVCTKSVLIWQAFLGSEGLVRVFYCSSDGSNKKFASGKIHFQFLFMWQEIHQGKCETHVLLFTSTSYERKHVSDLSMLVFCFRGHTYVVYLQKSTTIAFSRNSLYTFYSRNPTCGISPCFRISNRKYPPPLHALRIP